MNILKSFSKTTLSEEAVTIGTFIRTICMYIISSNESCNRKKIYNMSVIYASNEMIFSNKISVYSIGVSCRYSIFFFLSHVQLAILYVYMKWSKIERTCLIQPWRVENHTNFFKAYTVYRISCVFPQVRVRVFRPPLRNTNRFEF